MKRIILSGIQPTGIPHLGNYLGALKQWKTLQSSQEYDCIYSIADLHSITVHQDPIALKKNIKSLLISLLAIGIDPQQSILFRQSRIKQHPELAWILYCKTPINWLKRMHQWKFKSMETDPKESENHANLGLLSYPVLQTADILLYNATHVPVGEDQVQHLNLAYFYCN